MDKEGRLYKLFNGSDTAVWAHDEIIKQDKRIAELENIINSQVFPSSGDGFSSQYIKGYEKALGDLDKRLKEKE